MCRIPAPRELRCLAGSPRSHDLSSEGGTDPCLVVDLWRSDSLACVKRGGRCDAAARLPGCAGVHAMRPSCENNIPRAVLEDRSNDTTIVTSSMPREFLEVCARVESAFAAYACELDFLSKVAKFRDFHAESIYARSACPTMGRTPAS